MFANVIVVIVMCSVDTITGRTASVDTKRTYQGIKFLVGLANKLVCVCARVCVQW